MDFDIYRLTHEKWNLFFVLFAGTATA